MTVECPTCGAAPGQPCTTRSGAKAAKAHAKRPKAGETAAAPQAPEAQPELLELPAVLVRGGEPTACTPDLAVQLLQTLKGATVTVDCETSGYPYGHHLYALRTVQLGTKDWAVDLDAQDPFQLLLAAATMDAAAELVAHSATADVSLVANATGRDSGPWWAKTTDTAVLAALADPELVGEKLGLEDLSSRLLGDQAYKPTTAADRKAEFRKHKWLTNTEATTPLERSGWANIPNGLPVMVRYAAADILDTAALAQKLPRPAAEVLERERAVEGIMARLPERGLRLDPDRVRTEAASTTQAAQEAAQTLASRWGVQNPGSTQQVAQVVESLGVEVARTEKGAPSTDKAAMEALQDLGGIPGDFATDVLAWRKVDKLRSTYLDPLLLQVDLGTGRTHPTVLTLGAAATGRMSSVRPNIQQVPRPTKHETMEGGTGGLRGMFVADPGMRFIAADFSSVEVRIAAALTGDETLAHMVREGLDLHGAVVQMVTGLDPERDKEAFSDARYSAKRAVFGYLYGAGLKTMARQLGKYGHLAQQVVDALGAITPTLVQWNRALRTEVEAGRLPSWRHESGRVAYFNRNLPHKALNMVVQGWGRELLVDAILRWEAMHPGCTIVPIHDELVVQVPAEHAEAWVADLEACMSFTIGHGGSQVPIVCESDPPTTRWGTVDHVEVPA